MQSANSNYRLKFAFLLLALFPLYVEAASEADKLTTLVQTFLGSAHKQAAHRMFWAEDVIYTSSNGTRFGKPEILDGFADAESSEQPPDVVYSAEDIDVRVYGTAAIVAFRLVGTPADGSQVLNYFNTGTFLKREGRWQVVAWHATSIDDATVPEHAD